MPVEGGCRVVDAIGRSPTLKDPDPGRVLVSPHRTEIAPSDAPALWNSGMSNALSVTARLSAPWLHVSQAQSSVALATPHSHTATVAGPPERASRKIMLN